MRARGKRIVTGCTVTLAVLSSLMAALFFTLGAILITPLLILFAPGLLIATVLLAQNQSWNTVEKTIEKLQDDEGGQSTPTREEKNGCSRKRAKTRIPKKREFDDVIL